MRAARQEAPRRTGSFARAHAACSGPRSAAICALLLLLPAAGCAQAEVPSGRSSAPGALRLRLADGLAPECHEATESWLQRIAAVGHAQDRAAARQLLQSGAWPSPTRTGSNASSSSEAATARPRTERLGRDLPEGARSVHAPPAAATALLASSTPRHRSERTPSLQVPDTELPRGAGAAATDTRVHVPAVQGQGGGDRNDGPALRAAFVPVEGTEAQWLSAAGWPADRLADPCAAGSSWGGVSCSSDGRVKEIDFGGRRVPAYRMGTAVANLTGLQYM